MRLFEITKKEKKIKRVARQSSEDSNLRSGKDKEESAATETGKKPRRMFTLEAKCGGLYFLKVASALSLLQGGINTAQSRGGVCDYNKSETVLFLRLDGRRHDGTAFVWPSLSERVPYKA